MLWNCISDDSVLKWASFIHYHLIRLVICTKQIQFSQRGLTVAPNSFWLTGKSWRDHKKWSDPSGKRNGNICWDISVWPLLVLHFSLILSGSCGSGARERKLQKRFQLSQIFSWILMKLITTHFVTKYQQRPFPNFFFFHHHKIENVEVKYLLFYLLHLAFQNTKEDVQVMKI